MRNVKNMLLANPRSEGRWRTLTNKLGLLIAVMALMAFFWIQNANFCSPYNLTNIGRQAVTLGLLALGETYVLVGSGVDLSVGGIMNLTSVTVALVLLETNSLAAAILAGLFVGFLMGALNGFIVSYLNVQAFAATLGSTSIASGAALLLCNGNSVRGLPDSLLVIANESFLGIPNQIWILILTIGILHILLQYTAFGQSCYAVGVGSGNPVIGGDMQLRAIAATVIGGASMRGGMGSVPGTVIGVIFISVLYSGMNFMGITSYVQDVLIGCIIVASAWIDVARRKKNG